MGAHKVSIYLVLGNDDLNRLRVVGVGDRSAQQADGTHNLQGERALLNHPTDVVVNSI